MDTDSLYLALAEKELYDCIRSEKSKSGNRYAPKTVMICSLQTLAAMSFPGRVVLNTKDMIKKEPRLFKEEIRCTEMLSLCSKTNCCYNSLNNKFKFSSKRLNKRTFEDSGDKHMAKYRKRLDETENVTSANRRFCTKNHFLATYEQTKKKFSYFYPKRVVESNEVHTLPLKFNILLYTRYF